jgi:putative endonuclease
MGLLFLNSVFMASIYILYSLKSDSYYIGSCNNFVERLEQHQTKTFGGFTSNEDDWKLFYSINDLNYQQARNIESHIKKMKSRKYLENLSQFPEIMERLILKYSGSSR